MKWLKIGLLILLLAVSGCIEEEAEFTPKELCIMRCLEDRDAGVVDLSDGPCLGIVTEDWVCDVSHTPRIPIDDNPENQCPQYRDGTANHFIEVSPECKFIQQK